MFRRQLRAKWTHTKAVQSPWNTQTEAVDGVGKRHSKVRLGSEDEHPVKEMNKKWFGSLRRFRKSVWREAW